MIRKIVVDHRWVRVCDFRDRFLFGRTRNRHPFVDLFEARLPYGLPCVLKGVRSLEFWSDDMAD